MQGPHYSKGIHHYNVANSYDSKHQVRLAKEEQLKKLREDFEIGEKVQSESRCCVSLPTEEAHHNTHPTRRTHLAIALLTRDSNAHFNL